MYEQYYNLTGRPFQLTPDPIFYFESATHRKAMSYLGYGLAQGEGFIVITGEIGAGKTTLVGHLMHTIDPQRLTAVKIVSTQVGGEDMLRLAAHAFGISTEGVEKAHVLSRIEAFMHHQARAGRRSLLIVDEAQNLSHEALEALRLLSNFQLGGQSLVQIFLLGQPEFRQAIYESTTMEQLRQRIIATHHLEPMQAEEVRPYMEHRLKVVGWSGNPRFTAEAYDAVAQASGCVPRRLNALVHRLLERAANERRETIDAALVEAACADMAEEFAPVEVVPGGTLVKGGVAAEAAPQRKAELQALRADVHSLRTAMEDAAEQEQEPSDGDRLARIEARLGRIETRLEDQDEALRRILSKLIDWMDEDEGAVANRAA